MRGRGNWIHDFPMSIPPYIPGVAATVLAVGAAVLSPSEADGLTEVGFLRWLIVAVTGGGGVLLWKVLALLGRIEIILSEQAQAKDELMMDAAKGAFRNEHRS
jgi:hypothetical protein